MLKFFFPFKINYHVRTGYLDEKSAATYLLGVLAEKSEKNILPFLKDIMKSLLKLSGYFHEDVRDGVSKSFASKKNFFSTFIQIFFFFFFRNRRSNFQEFSTDNSLSKRGLSENPTPFGRS